MINVAICDDEVIYSDYIFKIINNLSEKKHLDIQIDIFSSGEQLLKAFETQDFYYNVIFLDIIMEGITGFEAAKRIKLINKNVQIIFVTTTIDFVLDGYDLGILNYIMKPIEKEKLENSFMTALNTFDAKKSNSFCISVGHSIKLIDVDDIIYFESYKRTIKVVTLRDTITYYDTIENIGGKIKNTFFVQPHRSYWVNLSYVKSIKKNEIELVNGTLIPLSRLRLANIKSEFMRYLSL